METERLRRFIEACSNFAGTFDNIPDVINFADSLGICKIYFIRHNGNESEEFYIFGETKPNNGECFNFTKEYSDETSAVAKLQRYPDAYPLSSSDWDLLNIFIESVFMTVYNYKTTQMVIRNKYYDSLTGLPNTDYFYKHLTKIISEGRIGEYTAAFLNLINCHTMNLLFGHDATNGLFRSFSNEVSSMLNKEDGELMARMGGDNFCVLVKTSRQKDFFGNIKSIDVKTTYNNEDIYYSIGVRAGIAILNNNIPVFSAVMGMISSALAFCRKDPTRTQAYFTKSFNDIEATSDNLPEQIKSDLEKGRFLVYYQPVFSADGSNLSLHGAEALIRWRRPDGMMNPDEFLETAEESGIITEIDFYVLNTVCSRIKEWLEEGITPTPISCNFSTSHLSDKSLAESIIKTIDKYGIDHKYIMFEFTEKSYRANPDAMTYIMSQLKANGIDTIIDNFGADSFSLSMLLNLDFKYLKISRKLLSDPDDRSVIVIKEIIELANKLGISVICEGVPNLPEVDILIETGCTLFQTELFEKALSERFFRNRLISENQ